MIARDRGPASPRSRRRAARSRAPGMPARSRDDLGGDRGIELADGEVIEKEERRRVADEDVVDAVVHEVARRRSS